MPVTGRIHEDSIHIKLEALEFAQYYLLKACKRGDIVVVLGEGNAARFYLKGDAPEGAKLLTYPEIEAHMEWEVTQIKYDKFIVENNLQN